MKKKILKLSRRHKQMIAAGADLVCLPMMFYFALFLHFDSLSMALLIEYKWPAFAAAITAVPIFIKLGLYRAVVRYIDQKIISTVVLGSTLSVLMLAIIVHILQPGHLSLPPFLIYWVTSIIYVLASRYTARGYFVGLRERSNKTRVAIYGAGKAGSMLANALKPSSEYLPVIFIDDSAQRQNTTIHGIKVYPAKQIEQLAKSMHISTVLLALPSISRREQRKILDRLSTLQLKIKVTPSITSLVKGIARVEDVRQIEIEDLLSRDPVAPDPKLLSVCIHGKAVLVSGAGGSIGSELCRQIVALNPKRLVLLDISEYALYTIEQELRGYCASHELDIELVACIGSVLDTEKCQRLMHTFEIHTVYHAAAYKHVPLVEHNPIEGIQNNVFGTLSLAKAAVAARVKCFVLVSTDKAVRPTNVMGATKRLAELVLQAFARQGGGTRFSMHHERQRAQHYPGDHQRGGGADGSAGAGGTGENRRSAQEIRRRQGNLAKENLDGQGNGADGRAGRCPEIGRTAEQQGHRAAQCGPDGRGDRLFDAAGGTEPEDRAGRARQPARL